MLDGPSHEWKCWIKDICGECNCAVEGVEKESVQPSAPQEPSAPPEPSAPQEPNAPQERSAPQDGDKDGDDYEHGEGEGCTTQEGDGHAQEPLKKKTRKSKHGPRITKIIIPHVRKQLAINPRALPKHIHPWVLAECDVAATVQDFRVAIRAARRAAFFIEKKYLRLFPSFVQHFQEKDPGATLDLQISGGLFERFFFAPSACKEAQRHCRPILGLDGTFSRGKWAFCNLTAVTLDSNDHTILVASAIVPTESEQTWTWFLNNLERACPAFWTQLTCVLSDRDKGLHNAVATVIPHAQHLYCCWHLALNSNRY